MLHHALTAGEKSDQEPTTAQKIYWGNYCRQNLLERAPGVVFNDLRWRMRFEFLGQSDYPVRSFALTRPPANGVADDPKHDNYLS